MDNVETRSTGYEGINMRHPKRRWEKGQIGVNLVTKSCVQKSPKQDTTDTDGEPIYNIMENVAINHDISTSALKVFGQEFSLLVTQILKINLIIDGSAARFCRIWMLITVSLIFLISFVVKNIQSNI